MMRSSHVLRLVPLVKSFEGPVGLHDRLLDEVLGVGAVACHAQCAAVEGVDVGQDVAYEATVQLCFRGVEIRGVGVVSHCRPFAVLVQKC
jgi:hypothetical protein